MHSFTFVPYQSGQKKRNKNEVVWTFYCWVNVKECFFSLAQLPLAVAHKLEQNSNAIIMLICWAISPLLSAHSVGRHWSDGDGVFVHRMQHEGKSIWHSFSRKVKRLLCIWTESIYYVHCHIACIHLNQKKIICFRREAIVAILPEEKRQRNCTRSFISSAVLRLCGNRISDGLNAFLRENVYLVSS